MLWGIWKCLRLIDQEMYMLLKQFHIDAKTCHICNHFESCFFLIKSLKFLCHFFLQMFSGGQILKVFTSCIRTDRSKEGRPRSDTAKRGVWSESTMFANLAHHENIPIYNFDPLKPHFYIVKLGFTGVYIIFLISGQKHRLWVLVRTASSRRF